MTARQSTKLFNLLPTDSIQLLSTNDLEYIELANLKLSPLYHRSAAKTPTSATTEPDTREDAELEMGKTAGL